MSITFITFYYILYLLEIHGFESGKSLYACKGKVAYVYSLKTSHGGSLVHWAVLYIYIYN